MEDNPDKFMCPYQEEMLCVQTVENVQAQLRSCDISAANSAFRKVLCPSAPYCLFQWAQRDTAKAPLQHWNTSVSLNLHILITSNHCRGSIWTCDLPHFHCTENLSRNLLKNSQKESKSMQLFSFHSSATSAATAWCELEWELQLHVREATDTWAVSDCCRALHWCHSLVLNQCPYIKSVFTQVLCYKLFVFKALVFVLKNWVFSVIYGTTEAQHPMLPW